MHSVYVYQLTHLPLGEMASKLQTIKSSAISSMEIGWFRYFSLKSVPWSVINGKSSFVSTMAKRWIDDKPLSKSIMIVFNDTYIRG